ncbi:hypothetical protein KGO5_01717 [Sinorhizobium sp. KGO-5]|uniref:hypothetical protein n=1 Tax=Sinorhizobium sp. KGO-5 TaxID=1470810 RepID=UPI002949D69D|nr:hypothetical protein KGO5_01717 [Sinorhizobium sp. KGO-5]
MSINIACRCGQHRMDFAAYLLMSAVARNAFRTEIETCRGCDNDRKVQPAEARV